MRNQRKTTREQTDKLIVEGNTCETGEEICKAWASHFQKLALPLENENFDNEYKLLVDMDIESITAICEAESKNIDPVTEQEVTKALRKLKNIRPLIQWAYVVNISSWGVPLLWGSLHHL